MKRTIIALALAVAVVAPAQAEPYVGFEINKDYSLYAGWQFGKHIGLEVGHWGGVSEQSQVATYNPYTIIPVNKRFYEQTYTREDTDSNFVRLRAALPLSKSISLYGTLAAHNARTESTKLVTTVTTTNPVPPAPPVQLNSTSTPTQSTSTEWVAGYGVGIAFRWGETPFDVMVGYEKIDLPGNAVESGTVGVRWLF